MSQNHSRFGASARNCRFTRSSWVAVSGFPPAPLPAVRDPDQPVQAHQPGDAFPADVNAETEAQLGEHPRGAIGLAGVGVDAADRARQLRIRDRTP